MPLKVFVSKSNKKHLNKLVLAIGGGSVIDKAKIYAKKNKMVCLAIPTTAAGASETRHSVVWGKEKINIGTDKPVSVKPPFKVKLSKTVRAQTTLDLLGHIVDYVNVCADNELIELGMLGGKLIEKHPTNLTHPMSYPLTLKHGIPHGFAVGLALRGLGVIK
jgi:alcohol dehydrogenase class IV